MAPEQIESPHVVDHRADLYSLGVVFYELLTGELPLGRFALPSEKSSAIPGRLDDVVMRTLEKDPGRRFQQASQLKTACESVHASVRDGNVPFAQEAESEKHRGDTDGNHDETFSTSQVCQPFPVTIEDIYVSLAAGYGVMRGFESHIELEYEIRDAIVDHKWASQTAKVPLNKIDWIKLHKGLIYSHIEIQADHVDAVNELPNSKTGLFRVYLKKAHRQSAEQLVSYVQQEVSRRTGKPVPPIKTAGQSHAFASQGSGSSPVAIALLSILGIASLCLVAAVVVWVLASAPVSVQVQPKDQGGTAAVQELPEMPSMPEMKSSDSLDGVEQNADSDGEAKEDSSNSSPSQPEKNETSELD